MTDYQQLLDAVEQYYGSGSDQWAEIAKYGIASDKAESILSQVPNVNIVKNSNGTIRSYNLKVTENVADPTINSNTSPIIKSFEVPSNSGIETVTSGTGEAVKQMTFKSGVKQAGKFTFGTVAPAIAATATGITLGKAFDKLLYSVNPDFWDEHGMSTLNPDVWGDIIGTDSAGARVLNTILGTTPDGKTQVYMDENALAYMAMYLNNKNVFARGEDTYSKPSEEYEDKFFNYNNIKDLTFYNIPSGTMLPRTYINNPPDTKTITVNTGDPQIFLFNSYVDSNVNDRHLYVYGVSNQPFKITVSHSDGTASREYNSEHYTTPSSYSKNDFYGAHTTDTNAKLCDDLGIMYTLANIHYVNEVTKMNDMFALTKYGIHDIGQSIDGISDQDGAKTPDLSGVDTVDDALNKLKEQYPDLFTNAINQDVVQPDGSTKTYTYVPISMPEIDPAGNPVSSPSTQANPQVNPETATQPLIDLITSIIQRVPPTNPPDTGDGDTPVVPPVTGSASSLYAIYNPTLSQINSFGAWLWSDNFIDQIKKLFNDPMQAIIGLHKIYAQPITGGSQNIKVGYLDSGVSSKTVSNQYTTIDCGTVQLSEQFYNVFDYAPYTDVNLYLPFIGIVNLNVSDIMRSSIHIIYHVDVLSGACLAEVKIIRDGSGGTLYQYAGNASVTLPISSGSYMGIVASVAGIAGGIAGTIASGGSALPLIVSSASSALNARTRVEHSGGFSGNAGAMGGKIPYLIISRPQTELANNFENFIGYPSNFTATIGSCTGFIKVIECHVENTNATNSELTEISTMLQEGVIV